MLGTALHWSAVAVGAQRLMVGERVCITQPASRQRWTDGTVRKREDRYVRSWPSGRQIETRPPPTTQRHGECSGVTPKIQRAAGRRVMGRRVQQSALRWQVADGPRGGRVYTLAS